MNDINYGNNLPQNTNGNNPFEVFNYKNLGQVRTFVNRSTNLRWFCLSDVCRILNIGNITDVKNRLSSNVFDSIEVLTNGGPQKMLFVDQGGLYEAIGNSKKPEARNFMTWVYREVLPSIANTGSYTMEPMSEMEMINKMSGVMIDYGNRLDNHDQLLELHSRQIELVAQQGYFRIIDVAKFRGIPMTLETAQKLGAIATQICEHRNEPIGSIPHPEFGLVHVYKLDILNEVFDRYYA